MLLFRMPTKSQKPYLLSAIRDVIVGNHVSLAAVGDAFYFQLFANLL